MVLELEVVEDLHLKSRTGFEGIGEYNKDKSDDLEDMNYAEKIVTTPEVIKAMSELSVVTEEKVDGETLIHGGTILLTKPQIALFREDKTEVEISSAATMFNKVFVALEVPYFAKAYASDNAQEVEKTGKRGKKEGKQYKVIPADKLRIYKIGEKFDIDKYFADKSARVLSGEVKTSHQPTDGMIARENKWLDENATELAEVFKKLGLEVVAESETGTGS